MRIRVFASPRAAARGLAAEVARAVEEKPDLVLALPTGRTPLPFYRELARLYDAGRLDLSRVTTFNLDELGGLEPSDPRSYRAYMQRHLFDHVNVPRRRIRFLNGAAADPDAECRRYDRAIARAGGIDLLVLGLGSNGHVGFNEPGRRLVAASHRARLTRSTRRANAALFGFRAADVPREGLTMGLGTIFGARRIVLVATGRGKARCAARMVNGPVTTLVPASLLQLHPRAEAWLDRAAAAETSATSRAPA